MEWRQDQQGQSSTGGAAAKAAPGLDPAGPAARAQAEELSSTMSSVATSPPTYKTPGMQALAGRYPNDFAKATPAQAAAVASLDRELSGVWPALPWSNIQRQAALRILAQRKVRQEQYSLCGPAAVLQSLIDTDPESYARLVVEVFSRGSVHGKRVNSLLLESTTKPSDDWLWVGWMTLSAMRDVENLFFVTHGDTEEIIAGGTSTGDLKQMMKTHLQVRRFEVMSTWLIGSPVNHVPRVNAAVRAGAFVYVMLDKRKLDGKAPTRFAFPDHWVRLEAPIQINPTTGEATIEVLTDGSEITYTIAAQELIFEFVVGYR